MTHQKETWEKEVRRVFNPYAMELKFDQKDWNVFLERIKYVMPSPEKWYKKECISALHSIKEKV